MPRRPAAAPPTRRKGPSGLGTVRQRPNGSWEARYSVNGQQYSVYGRSEAEAITAMRTAQDKAARGLRTADARIPLGQFLDAWLDEVAAPTVEPSTLLLYAATFRRVDATLRRVRLSDLTPQRLQAWLTALGRAGYAPSTVAASRNILRIPLNDAVEWRLLDRNPVEATSPPRQEAALIEPLTEDEAQRVIAVFAGTILHAPVLTAVAAGLRRGELAGLRWADVDLAAHMDGVDGTVGLLTVRQQRVVERTGATVRVVNKAPKTRKGTRTVPVPALVVDALKAEQTRQTALRLRLGKAWPNSGHVFVDEDGRPWNPDNLYNRYKHRLRRADVPYRKLHQLRHGAATLWLAQGVELRVISELLGHSDVSITASVYAHVVPQLRHDAALRMGRALTPKTAPENAGQGTSKGTEPPRLLKTRPR